jgi:penicillin-binding protein 1A
MDFTLGLGSSGVTLYEMTKVFSQIGRLGQRIRPRLIDRVLSKDGELLLETISLDTRFEKEIAALDEEFEKQRLSALAQIQEMTQEVAVEDQTANGDITASGNNPDKDAEAKGLAKKDEIPPVFFENPDQLIRPQTAYLASSLLQGVIAEPGGTGGPARVLGRPLGGKTGTTNGYFDAWFIGYSTQVATGVWVGNDAETSLGRGEVGTRAALPIWIEYMKSAHNELPAENFPVPEGIVFANIDNDTGKLASTTSKKVIRQAFLEGTEPKETKEAAEAQDETSFYKEDLSE